MHDIDGFLVDLSKLVIACLDFFMVNEVLLHKIFLKIRWGISCVIGCHVGLVWTIRRAFKKIRPNFFFSSKIPL
jgi:hypothetical protein